MKSRTTKLRAAAERAHAVLKGEDERTEAYIRDEHPPLAATIDVEHYRKGFARELLRAALAEDDADREGGAR